METEKTESTEQIPVYPEEEATAEDYESALREVGVDV